MGAQDGLFMRARAASQRGAGSTCSHGFLGPRPDGQEYPPVETQHDDARHVEGCQRGPEDEGGVVEDAGGALALGCCVQAEDDRRSHATRDEPSN